MVRTLDCLLHTGVKALKGFKRETDMNWLHLKKPHSRHFGFSVLYDSFIYK